MNKLVIFFISFILASGCSFNKNSKFWTESKNIQEENELNYKKIFVEEQALGREFNSNLSINLDKKNNFNTQLKNYFNNDGRLNYDGVLKKSSRYKFSKIKNF